MPRDLKISLDKSRVRSLSFKLKKSMAKGEIPVSGKIAYNYKYNYQEKSITSLISVSITEEQVPFDLEIEYEGLFILNKRVPKKKIESLAEINCPAILFPFLRECIADITRRADLSPLMVPTINFVELAKEKKASGKKEKTQ